MSQLSLLHSRYYSFIYFLFHVSYFIKAQSSLIFNYLTLHIYQFWLENFKYIFIHLVICANLEHRFAKITHSILYRPFFYIPSISCRIQPPSVASFTPLTRPNLIYLTYYRPSLHYLSSLHRKKKEVASHRQRTSTPFRWACLHVQTCLNCARVCVKCAHVSSLHVPCIAD